MKLLSIFFTFIAFLRLSSLEANLSGSDFFYCDWESNKNALVLKIDLSDAFYFSKNYETEKAENGQSCTLYLYPKNETIITNENGYPLESIELFVTTNNTPDEFTVSYNVTSIETYAKRSWFSSSTSFQKTETSGLLEGLTINKKTAAQFRINPESNHEATISFSTK